MVRVEIITDSKNFSTEQFIDCMCEYNIMYIKNDEIMFDSKTNIIEYLITEYSNDSLVEGSGDIFILCCENVGKIKFKNNAVILMDSTEFTDYNAIVQSCNIISCGAGEKNTVSLSSVNEESLVLNIAREIFGLEIQECVIKTKRPIRNIYTAIFAYAVLVLTNKEAQPCIRDAKAI